MTDTREAMAEIEREDNLVLPYYMSNESSPETTPWPLLGPRRQP